MALNWDLSKIKDKDFYENCYIKMGKEGKENYQLSPQTLSLIHI